jgi:hypothetical protein
MAKLTSPIRDTLAFYEEQKTLAEEKAEHKPVTLQAYVPGAGVPLPRNAQDVAWSEYNHHMAGAIVLVMGILVLLEKTGKAPWARHWPLLLVVLAGFLFLRSEAEGWPTGSLSLADSLRDPEFIQHKTFMVLMTGFAGFRMERAQPGDAERLGEICVSPHLRARRHDAADTFAFHRQCQRAAVAGDDPHAAGGLRHLVGLDPLAGVAPGRRPGEGDRRLAMADLLLPDRAHPAALSGSLNSHA